MNAQDDFPILIASDFPVSEHWKSKKQNYSENLTLLCKILVASYF